MPINTIFGTAGADRRTGTNADDLIYGAQPFTAAAETPAFALVTGGLGQAVDAAAAPGVAGRLYVLTRDGIVRGVNTVTGEAAATPFLDLRGVVSSTLGIAFHPDYATNGRFFVFTVNNSGDSEIREYRVDPADPERALADSGRTILVVAQPAGNGHRGGSIEFADDGTLLITTGDAGYTDDPDPYATGQSPYDLLGSVLRIDVDGDDFPNASRRNYAIPDDNPFAAGGGAPEVLAFGLRNPFRLAVDQGTGDIFTGDVGQDTWEEINLITPGGNYGWSNFEGPAPFPPGSPPGSSVGLTAPIFAYAHASGDGQSVTGGIVYRGPETGLQGRYVFGDFVTGRIWAIDDRDGDGVWQRIEIDNGGLLPGTLVGFAEDAIGSLFAIGLGFGANANGTLYRLRPGRPLETIDLGDTLNGGAGDDRIFAGAGRDSVLGGDGNDKLQGMEDADTLRGGNGNDSVIGGNSDDSLFGDAGNDTLLGDVGLDTLNGGAGNDVLVGGNGSDVLLGGGGRDIFRYTNFGDSQGRASLDRITDFVRGADHIDVSALTNGQFAFIGGAAFTANGGAQLRVVAVTNGTLVEATVDGVGLADLVIQVEGASTLTATDFFL